MVSLIKRYFEINLNSVNKLSKKLTSCKKKKKITNTGDSVSRVTNKARAVKRSFGVVTAGISVTVVCKMTIFIGYLSREALVNI